MHISGFYFLDGGPELDDRHDCQMVRCTIQDKANPPVSDYLLETSKKYYLLLLAPVPSTLDSYRQERNEVSVHFRVGTVGLY